MLAYYGALISPNQTETVEGYLICRNVPIARIGRQDYMAGELQLDGDPERLVPVFRHEEDVFEPAALASFEGKPVTRLHPPESVGPENHGAYALGHAQNIRRDRDFVLADLYINDPGLAADIKSGALREVSCGYICQYEPDGSGFRQTHIRGNHVAVVPKGRAGREVAIKDAAQSAEKGRNNMSDFWKSILTAFGKAAKDASPEDLEAMVSTTAQALDAAPAEKAPEAEPAKEEPTGDVMVERAPRGDDLGSKLDELLEMMHSIMKKNDREEKKLEDGDGLEELITRLSGGEGSVTIPADELDVACSPGARDAALALLTRVRPAVAAIQDKKERARVTDALINAVKGKDVFPQVLSAQHDSAKSSTPRTFEQVCADRKAACDARNPHKKKEA